MHPGGPLIPNRLAIGSLDDADANHTVTAHYNPSDITLEHRTNWSDEDAIKAMTKKGERSASGDRDDLFNDLQYTGTSARVMSLTLFLDQVERRFENQDEVETIVQKLHMLATPRDETRSEPQYLRPHLCVVAWGHRSWPSFVCVIEAVDVKYLMFDLTGAPLRATCALKLKEIRTKKGPQMLERFWATR